ncbi:MAG: hypothetical protein ACOCXH_12190 [Cyclobacteriaceae bacterium]
MKKLATILAVAFSVFVTTIPSFASYLPGSSEINTNVNDNNNKRAFYVKITDEGEGQFKLLVKGSKIEPIEVKIFDSSKNLIAKDFIDNAKSFTKMYNLAQVKSKKIIFEVINREVLIAKEEFK